MKDKLNRTIPISEDSTYLEIFTETSQEDLEKCRIKKLPRYARK